MDGSRPGVPRIFLLDGASGAGKTSLGLQVASERSDALFIPRYTTRPKRADSDEEEYVFVDQREFDRLVAIGAFIEYRHYEFGMSYGLPSDTVQRALASGKNALAILNLGHSVQAKSSLPAAVTILIDVPIDVIHKRLLSRGTHRPDQVAERLKNAAAVEEFRASYDYTVENSASLESAVKAINMIIDRHC
jgi:phosphonate metabolism protein PhnN/1,5-bisphosphokinase (PRPP-forming)